MRKLFWMPLISLAIFGGSTCAKDLGVSGKTWPITEEDIRKVIAQELVQKDPTEFNQKLKDSAKNFVKNLPKRGFPRADTTATTYVDLSIELTSDIQGPVKLDDGTIAWRVLWPKGTKVNPLESVAMNSAILFFDGDDPQQLAFVQKANAKYSARISIVEAGSGNIDESTKKLGRPVFYANDLMLQKFKIEKLPTLVYPGEGDNKAFLGNTAYALPYTLEDLAKTWSRLKLTE